MPAAGYRRPDRLDAAGLVVSAIGTDGGELGPFDFGVAPANGQVRSHLVGAFVTATGPDGRWRSPASMASGYTAVLEFLRGMDRVGIKVTSLDQLTPEHWWAWRAHKEAANRWPGQVNLMRVLLKEAPEVSALTRHALSQRTHKPRKRLYGSYTVTEFEAIRRRAAEMVRACETRISPNVTALERHRDGDVADDEPTVTFAGRAWSRGQLLERLQADGRLMFGPTSRILERRVAALLGTGDLHPTYGLYPKRVEVVSLMVLLVCDRGYNLSTLNSLGVPELASGAGAGGDDDDTVLLAHLDKPRRGHRRYFTHSFSGSHARLLRQALTITGPARQCLAGLGYPTEQLLIAGSSIGVSDHPTRIFVTTAFTNGGAVRRWDLTAAIPAADGQLVHLHFNRLRLSEQVINRKSSQNTDAVSEDVYRRPDALTAALLQDVILEGQAEAVGHAQDSLQMRYADSVEHLELPVPTATAVAAGTLDTATGACIDFTHSPFTPHGHACTASFLMCLACPNAIATRAHLPRLLALRDGLENLASVNPTRFQRLYRDHYDRLKHLLSTSTTPAEREDAQRATSDTDVRLIERLLRRDLDA